MRIQTFKLERQFALYKAKAKYMLSQTSCEGCSMREILDMADAECRMPRLFAYLDLALPGEPSDRCLHIRVGDRGFEALFSIP